MVGEWQGITHATELASQESQRYYRRGSTPSQACGFPILMYAHSLGSLEPLGGKGSSVVPGSLASEATGMADI